MSSKQTMESAVVALLNSGWTLINLCFVGGELVGARYMWTGGNAARIVQIFTQDYADMENGGTVAESLGVEFSSYGDLIKIV